MSHLPTATYRLQFHPGFTFEDGRRILDYLDKLGISDVYSSPFFQASPGSTHGYDIADHNRLSPALGGPAAFAAFTAEMRARNLHLLLDFVPNHMGISESVNEWWMEVLEDGVASRYARYFDIDWESAKAAWRGKVVLPILGDRYGKLLERGELAVRYSGGAFSLHYYQTRLPICPESYPFLLRGARVRLNEPELAETLQDLTAWFAELPAAANPDSRVPSKEKAIARLRELTESYPAIAQAISDELRRLNGTAGDPASFDDLHALLERQHYRLSYWRMAAEEINYRRFFDINTLAAIRVEMPEVFAAAHSYVFQLLRDRIVSGLRIDHIDGLWNPREYLARLQEHAAAYLGDSPDGLPLYLLVEKILDATHEQLPADWPVQGTTGYEFANQVVQLLVDSSAERHLTKTYSAFTGSTRGFEELVYEKKLLIAQLSFASEVASLGRLLDELSEWDRHYRDVTQNRLTTAVREVLACFPVYRTYATPDGHLSREDERHILRAVSLARRRNPAIEKPVFDFLRNLLLLRFPDGLSEERRERHVAFVMKFQQCSGPLMAKGVEDTALYLYPRLLALNEVGGNPGKFGIESSEFHRLNAGRQRHWPHCLLATSTHDTKRSEDVRMRLAAISEMPGKWRKAVSRWARLNRKHRRRVGDEWAPSANEEYLIYQTLLGIWPLEELTPASRADLTGRLQEYLLKALKEGKVNSSWTEPNEEWEAGVSAFIGRILDEKSGQKFLNDLIPFAEEIARLGAMNSLNQTILKCTLPGVPDIYQGNEIWDFSLVDPDNRRPVDYGRRRELLEWISSQSLEELLRDWKSGGIKLRLLKDLLHFRRNHPEFFQRADYQPLEVKGTCSGNAVVFIREWQGRRLLVAVSRLTSQLPAGDAWKDALLDLPAAGWQSVLEPGPRVNSMPGENPLAPFLPHRLFGVWFSG